jgi:hypothetical protein
MTFGMNLGMRAQKCRDVIGGFPGGLSVESLVETLGNDCQMQISEQSDHVVSIKNRRLTRFRIEIVAECESAHLSYRDFGATWTAKVQVNARPDKGGQAERSLRAALDCARAFTEEGITVTVSYEVIGPRSKGSGSDTMHLLVDADG